MTNTSDDLLNSLEANAAAHLRGYPLARRTTAQHLIDAVERIRELEALLDALANRDAVSVTELIDIVYRASIRAATQEAD